MDITKLDEFQEPIKKLNKLAKIPMKSESEMKMVDILMLKYKDPEVETKAIQKIIENTDWPFRLTVYDNRQNTANTSRIWNKLIAESICDYILLIDSDAFVPKTEPCWLTRMMITFEEHPETQVVIPVSNNVGGQHQKASEAKSYPTAVPNNGIWSGFCFLFRREAVEKVGKFDEQFYIYGQDSEWAFRWSKRGKNEVWMREDVFVEHIGGYSFRKAHENKEVDRETDKVRARLLYNLKTREKQA